jgi:hypothetical protein
MSSKIGTKQLSSVFIDQERLWRRHMELAKIGAILLGGVNRQALSPEDAKAQLQMIAWAPRKLNYGSSGVGNHLIAAQFLNDERLDLADIAFADAGPPRNPHTRPDP